MCNCCSEGSPSQNKVIPDTEAHIYASQYGRVNGWTCPLHPLQIICWFFIFLFAITHFGIIVHYVSLDWQPAAVILPACGFIIHLVYHLLVLTLDPADPAVRKKGTFLRKFFDRTKHKHVIENCYCYICQTDVSARSKHCSKCNKCISDFDHHCVWFNNCVGGRNYKLFLGSCISAFLTALVMFIIDICLIIEYYGVAGKIARNDYKLFVPVCAEAYIIFVFVNCGLLLISMLLLGHLLIFHGYLCFKKQSTYEYVVQKRILSKEMMQSDIESAGEAVPPTMDPLSSSHSNVYNDEEIKKQERQGVVEMGRIEENILYVNETDIGHTEASNLEVINERIEHKETVRLGSPQLQEVMPVVENHIQSVAVTNVYEEVDNIEKQPSNTDNPPFNSNTRKKKKKKRSSSQIGLLRSDNEEESLSSYRSASLNSLDNALVVEHTQEMVLNDFTALPQLTEDTAYDDTQSIVCNDSTIDRPPSPSLKQSQRISFVNRQQNDYVMRVMDKYASNSSLSTLALHDHIEDLSHNTSNTQSPYNTRSPKTSKPLSPTREESFDSKQSQQRALSKGSTASVRKIYVASKPEEGENGERALSPALSLSNHSTIVDAEEYKRVATSPRQSQVSQISLSGAVPRPSSGRIQRSPKNSISSQLTNVTLTSEKFPILPTSSETELTQPVPVDAKTPPAESIADSLVFSKVLSDDGVLIFEDQFDSMGPGQDNVLFLHNAINAEEEKKRKTPSSPKSPRSPVQYPPEEQKPNTGALSDAESQKLASYVEAFKRNRSNSQFSFGSDTAESESGVPLAVLHEESDSNTLKDSLQRVKKLSDAFPMAITDEKLQRNPDFPRPPMNTHESMSELSVVEYNQKKKLKKKRNSGDKQKQLPPLRGRVPLPELEEDNAESDV